MYGWYFLFLAAIQVRFAGQLSLMIAIFAGIGLVHLAAWIDVARQPAHLSGISVDHLTVPDRRQVFTPVGLFLLVAGLSIVQVPIKASQVTGPNEPYDAAAWMAEYSSLQSRSNLSRGEFERAGVPVRGFNEGFEPCFSEPFEK